MADNANGNGNAGAGRSVYVGSAANLGEGEKLRGSSNYHSWKFLMKGLLICESYWKAILGTETDADKISRAFYKIVFNCHPQIHSILLNLECPKAAWDKLKDLYEKNTGMGKVALLQHLTSCKLQNYDSVDAYLTDILATQAKLVQFGKGLDDEFVAGLMLIGLPNQYKSLRQTIEGTDGALTSDNVRQKITDASMEDASFGDDTAMVAQQWKPFTKKVTKCFYCNNLGHISRDCRIRMRDEKNGNSSVNNNKPNSNGKKQENKSGKNGNNNGKKGKHSAHLAEDNHVLLCIADGEPEHNTDVLCVADEESDLLELADLTIALDEEALLSVNDSRVSPWYVDSGATKHMCKDEVMFVSMSKPTTNQRVSVANNVKVPVTGTGDVKLSLDVGSRCLKDVLFVPELSSNLLSVAAMIDKGLNVQFDRSGCIVTTPAGQVLLTAKKCGGLFRVNLSTEEVIADQAFLAKVNPSNQDLWHRRLGHLCWTQMRQLQGNVEVGKIQSHQCIVCMKGKMQRESFPPSKTKCAPEPLQLIHADLFGPMKVASYGGAKFVLLLMDDHSRKIFSYPIKNKSDVPDIFEKFQKLVQNQKTGFTIKNFRSDNGGEFVNKCLAQSFAKAGIIHQTSSPHTPEQNGSIERANRTVIEMAACMLIDSGRDFRLWAEAVNAAVYVRNRSPSSVLNGMSPEEAWSGNPVSYDELKVFGCNALVYISSGERRKMEAKAKEMIFVGYAEASKAYRFIDPSCPGGRVTKSCHAKFVEDQVGEKQDLSKAVSHPFLIEDTTIIIEEPAEPAVPSEETPEGNNESENISSNDVSDCSEESSTEELSNQDQGVPSRRASSRERKPKRDPDMVYYTDKKKSLEHRAFAAFEEFVSDDPKTVQEALSRPDADQWTEAMDEEMSSLKGNNTWTVSSSPPGKPVISTKWVFKLKRNASGEPIRHKARLVARGYSQVQGTDYFETFSPTIRHSSIRLLFSLAARNEWLIDHVDIKTAFLQGKLEEDVYIRLPEGSVEGDERVCKLNKAIYGLKQASRTWFKTLEKALEEMGFKSCVKEPCLFYKNQGDDIVVLTVYVDDLLIFSRHRSHLDLTKIRLAERFDCKDLGPVSDYLGVRIQRDTAAGTISLDQEAYVEEILARFGMSDCNSTLAPLPADQKLPPSDKESSCDKPYQSLVGSLMYLAVFTRPDIMHVVSLLSQFNNGYTDAHWGLARRVLRYLKGSADCKMTFSKSGDFSCFSDADWANSKEDRRSFSGFAILLGGAAISWGSKKQTSVALSTCEAEFVALTEVVKEAMFLVSVMEDVLKTPQEPIKVWCDNQGAIKWCHQEGTCGKLKHIDIRLFFIKDLVAMKLLDVQHISTAEQPADVLTKLLPAPKHRFCASKLGIYL